MASIYKEIVIEAAPEQVWVAVTDVGAVHQRLVPEYFADTRLDGDTRILTFPSGEVVRELIVAVDDEARRLVYAVIEGRLPIAHHHASFQVFAEGASHSRLVWITDVLPHELAAEIRLRVERGAVVMKQTLEEVAGPHLADQTALQGVKQRELFLRVHRPEVLSAVATGSGS